MSTESQFTSVGLKTICPSTGLYTSEVKHLVVLLTLTRHASHSMIANPFKRTSVDINFIPRSERIHLFSKPHNKMWGTPSL
jgi:hypothetical protein